MTTANDNQSRPSAFRPLAVVAAVIVDGDRALVSRRRAGTSNALKWEFPGGKIERGETPEAALEREISEELGICIQSTHIYDVCLHSYENDDVLLLFYEARISEGAPRPIDCDSLMWANARELRRLDFSDADRRVRDRLADSLECRKTDI